MITSRLVKTLTFGALTVSVSLLAPAAARAATLTVSNFADDGTPGTLRYLVNTANDGDVIVIPAGLPIVLSNVGAAIDTDCGGVVAAPNSCIDIDINRNITIQGAGVGQSVIDGNGPVNGASVFEIDSDNTDSRAAGAVVTGVTVQNGDASYGGGFLVSSEGTLRLADSAVVGNKASNDGGGISLDCSEYGTFVTLQNVEVKNNEAGGDAGGLNADCGGAIIENSLFEGNKAGSNAGALYSGEAGVEITDSRFLDNEAGSEGGAIYHNYASMVITGTADGLCVIDGNISDSSGGGIYNDDNLLIQNCSVTGNKTLNNNDGGGIYNDALLQVVSSNVSGNFSTNDGGGIYNNDVALVADSIIANNVSDSDSDNSGDGGGGIYNDSTLILEGSVVSGNAANYGQGGGIYLNDIATISGSSIEDNTTLQGDGGGVYVDGDGTIIRNSLIAGNRALSLQDGSGVDSNGGGVWSTQGIDLTNTTIANNKAEGHGGGIYTDYNITLNNVTITGNEADSNAGGDSGGDGGGIHIENTGTGPVLSVANTIIAGNLDKSAGAEAPDCYSNYATDKSAVQIAAPAIIQNLDGCEPVGDLTLLRNVDPLLDSAGLADNGGPTKTVSLQAGSPAIDTGEDGTCRPEDQRGEARPKGEHCDLGAVEVDVGSSTGGDTGGDTTGGDTTGGTTGGDSGGGCSLIR